MLNLAEHTGCFAPGCRFNVESNLIAKGMTVFIRINHAKGAQKLGMKLRPTEVVIFGNPKVGTPLMQCAARA
jgi:uncharacterized protein (DUF302 family)